MDQPINILIVDDEPKNLTVLETVLDDPGYRLVRAGSADEALLALLVEEFALLILDIRMPSVTGIELAKIIKERKKTALVPIIFLTAYYNEDQHILEGYGTGAVDYLHKPVNPAILRSKVAVFGELHRRQREADRANCALMAEVTERRRAEEQLRELNTTLEQRVSARTEALHLAMLEVNHRAKNLLAVVQAVAQLSAFDGDPQTYVMRLSERIGAISASQDLLVRNEWHGVQVMDLVEAQLSHFKDLIGTRLLLDGPTAWLTPNAAQGIGMALHELVTNAAKHGALTNSEGRVRISWQVTDAKEATFKMCWLEEGGPKVARPNRKGFGHTVIGPMAGSAVAGTAEIEYRECGISWRLTAPIAETLQVGEGRVTSSV